MLLLGGYCAQCNSSRNVENLPDVAYKLPIVKGTLNSARNDLRPIILATFRRFTPVIGRRVVLRISFREILSLPFRMCRYRPDVRLEMWDITGALSGATFKSRPLLCVA